MHFVDVNFLLDVLVSADAETKAPDRRVRRARPGSVKAAHARPSGRGGLPGANTSLRGCTRGKVLTHLTHAWNASQM